ncbi:S-layer homology domain-containing protein, partial [Nitriliruptoraceae bacterium ZYF776]|nr:S-layer homology domain-containing protein [Profundirhabdus halotolerans]
MSRPRSSLLVASLILATTTLPAAADTAPDPASSGMDGFEFVIAPTDEATTSTRSVHTSSSVGGADGCPTPTDPQPAPRFRDIAGSAHAANIDCVARWGIASGTSATSYAPRRDVTRAQMATFVANLIRATGTALPEGRDRFPDDDGSPHEPNINALAN